MRLRNRITIPTAFAYQSQKRMEYTIRAYYQFEETKLKGGQQFFYTLTYNDDHLPTFLGRNCHDYNDIRYLTVGAFAKKLLRHYNLSMKYMISSECGEGKGKRGYGQNPHYHIIFDLRPLVPGASICPIEFRSLLREYWQGVDEDPLAPGSKPQQYKFGIVQEGQNLGQIDNAYNASAYVSKYLVKTIDQRKEAREVLRELYLQVVKSFERVKYYKDFLDNTFDEYDFRLHRYYQIYTETNWCNSPNIPHYDAVPRDDEDFLEWLCLHHCWNRFSEWFASDINEEYRKQKNEYRNRYAPKVRISNGFGDYALNFVDENNKVPLMTFKGHKLKKIGSHLYRKLYKDWYVDPITKTVRYKDKDSAIIGKIQTLDDVILHKTNCVKAKLQKSSRPELASLSNMYSIFDTVYRDRIIRLTDERFYDDSCITPEVYQDYLYNCLIDAQNFNHFRDVTPKSDYFCQKFVDGVNPEHMPFFAPFRKDFEDITNILDISCAQQDQQKYVAWEKQKKVYLFQKSQNYAIQPQVLQQMRKS
ncbi:replication initiator protein [Capybara microvirus Cap3_SP_423]|nr:replication initiator protein [Capybara microvirus Cap3_SP_423]